MDFRRFRYVTDDNEKRDKLKSLISEKNLSHDDLLLILTSLNLNFDIFEQYFEELF